MKIILTNNKLSVKVDDEDYSNLVQWNWLIEYGYAQRLVKGIRIRMHREIMNATKGKYIDHINGDKLDNRKENLRFCTQRENSKNVKVERKNNTSGYKGVAWKKQNKKWRASIFLNYKNIHIGYYDTKEKAALAYNEAAIKYHGEFARLNIIKGKN